jgi:microcystin-dependent protein
VAITSFPFDGQDTDENQFSLLFRELQDSGVADTHGGTGFSVAPSTGMAVQVQPGLALVRGFAISSTAVETYTIPTSATGTTIHRLVLRLNPTANTITIEILSGSAGGATPVLTQTSQGNYEIPLAPTMLTDDRDFLGSRVGVWSTEKRPTSPRKGRSGYNVSLGYMEFYTGSTWAPVAPQPPVGTITMSALPTVPANHLVCDGTEYPNTAYPVLAAAIGTLYGGTPGSTFKVPNFKDGAPTQAYGTEARSVGKSGGSTTKTLAVANLPAHAHTINHSHGSTPLSGGHTHAHRSSDRDGASNAVMKSGSSTGDGNYNGSLGVLAADSQHSHPIPAYAGSSGSAGSGTAFDVTNPWTAINFLIKAA